MMVTKVQQGGGAMAVLAALLLSQLFSPLTVQASGQQEYEIDRKHIGLQQSVDFTFDAGLSPDLVKELSLSFQIEELPAEDLAEAEIGKKESYERQTLEVKKGLLPQHQAVIVKKTLDFQEDPEGVRIAQAQYRKLMQDLQKEEEKASTDEREAQIRRLKTEAISLDVLHLEGELFALFNSVEKQSLEIGREDRFKLAAKTTPEEEEALRQKNGWPADIQPIWILQTWRNGQEPLVTSLFEKPYREESYRTLNASGSDTFNLHAFISEDDHFTAYHSRNRQVTGQYRKPYQEQETNLQGERVVRIPMEISAYEDLPRDFFESLNQQGPGIYRYRLRQTEDPSWDRLPFSVQIDPRPRFFDISIPVGNIVNDREYVDPKEARKGGGSYGRLALSRIYDHLDQAKAYYQASDLRENPTLDLGHFQNRLLPKKREDPPQEPHPQPEPTSPVKVEKKDRVPNTGAAR